MNRTREPDMPNSRGLSVWHHMRSHRGRAAVLICLVTLQAVSAFFFLGDVISDFVAGGLVSHTVYEAIATVALLLGVGFGGLEISRIVRRNRHAEDAIRLAAGAFGEMLSDRFDRWGLTPAESNVALLTLKGFDGPDIAELRGTATGTIRAQLGNIYSKSGTNGRGQFVSLFIDALLDEPVPGLANAKLLTASVRG